MPRGNSQKGIKVMGGGKSIRLELGVELERAVLAAECTRREIALALERRPDAMRDCVRIITRAVHDVRGWREFLISVRKGETFGRLMRAGNYDSTNGLLTSGRYPIRSTPPGERTIVLIQFEDAMTPAAMLREAERQGLERPMYEDCLRFGAQHPEVQREFPVVFLHEPLRDGSGRPDTLYLHTDLGKLTRLLSCSWPDCGYTSGCRFAFVRK